MGASRKKRQIETKAGRAERVRQQNRRGYEVLAHLGDGEPTPWEAAYRRLLKKQRRAVDRSNGGGR